MNNLNTVKTYIDIIPFGKESPFKTPPNACLFGGECDEDGDEIFKKGQFQRVIKFKTSHELTEREIAVLYQAEIVKLMQAEPFSSKCKGIYDGKFVCMKLEKSYIDMWRPLYE